MNAFWFVLAAIFVVVYTFNVGVATTPVTKNIVNIIAIIATIVLAIAASTDLLK